MSALTSVCDVGILCTTHPIEIDTSPQILGSLPEVIRSFLSRAAPPRLAACLPSSTACFSRTPRRRPSDSLGLYAPDERALLISFCLQPRLRHFGRLLAPGRIDHLLALHDSFMLDGYLRPLGDAEGTHLPVRRLAQLCSRLGGHGQRATAPAPSADGGPRRLAAHCDAAWYGSWGAVWRSLRGWLPTLRSASLASSGEGAQLEFRSSLALAFDRVSASLDAVCAHAHVALLPTGFHLPVIHTALVDGRSPAAAPPRRRRRRRR